MHFGLESVSGVVLYTAAIVAFLMSISKRPIAGIYYLVPLIPLQTIRYKLNGFPLGENVVNIMLLGVVIGLLRRREPIFPRTPWTTVLRFYSIYILISLLAGGIYLNRSPLISLSDPRFKDWRDYMIMPFLLFLVAATVTTTKQMKTLVLLMCLSVFLLDKSFWGTVSGRDFSTYSDDLRDEGSMGYAGVNGLAAFEAQCAVFLLALAAHERTLLLRLAQFALAGFSAVCLMYSLSRGGYAAFLVGWLFMGLAKERKLLLLLVLFAMVWAAIVPNAVRSRVFMTYDGGGELDHSSETRVTLWQDAMQVFDSNVLVGTGFNTYAYMGRVGQYRDTHNIYLKVLVETGILGILLFFWLLVKSFRTGFQLFRQAQDPFIAALGLGLAAWVVCAAVANCFGDRWNFLQVNGYMWIIAGLVARGWSMEQDRSAVEVELQPEPQELQLAQAF